MLDSNEDAKILAGGQSLVTLMKLRLASPTALVDINGIPELTHISEDNGTVRIGALTRHDQIARSGIIRKNLPLLAEAAGGIADQQVRNRGTLGGSLAHADPTADLPTACTALEATILVASAGGSRSIKSDNFFHDYFTTALRQGEIIQEVRIPIPPSGSGGSYLKLNRGHSDFAIVGVAAQITIDRDHVCLAASVVLGSVAPVPCHAKATERFLVGRTLDDRVIRECAQKASEGLNPVSDLRASAEYRLEMVRVLTGRAIEISANRATGSV